jgi:preprotein translocase subunit SecA
MIGTILKKVLGTKNERDLRRIQSRVDAINGLEEGISRLSDAELKAKSDVFKSIIRERTEGINDPAELREAEKAVLAELLP